MDFCVHSYEGSEGMKTGLCGVKMELLSAVVVYLNSELFHCAKVL